MKLFKSKTPQPPPFLSSPIRESEETEPQIPLSPEVKNIIRRKVSSYLNCYISLTPHLAKQITSIKKSKPLPKQFGEYANLEQFIRDQKVALHLYKQKIDRSMDECLYFYLKLFSLSVDYECRISEKQIDEESSVMIEAFLFLSSSLFEAAAEKAAFYFASIAITFCQYYKILHPIAQFLLILAKISRKHFKYKQSIIYLKKALQYNWWTDKRRVEALNNQFRKWLYSNSPEQAVSFDQKYEIGRVFDKSVISNRSQSHKADGDLRFYREQLMQFLEANKLSHHNLAYDVVLKKHLLSNQRSVDLQLQIYNEMSFNFLQLNKKEQSKLFAQKYESGYTEPQDSKIITLSYELINSIQKRVSGWHQMNHKNFQLLFFVDIFELLNRQRAKMRNFDEEIIMSSFNIIFDNLCDNFLIKEMFSYEIPLPLELKREVARTKKKSDGKKFIVRQRSTSQTAKQNVQVIKKYSSDKVEENLIFNYRGLKVCRIKLLDIYSRFLRSVQEVESQGSFRSIHWK